MKNANKRHSKDSGFRPFDNLQTLLKSKSFPLSSCPPEKPVEKVYIKPSPENEKKIFKDAMADVTPISREKYFRKRTKNICSGISEKNSDSETISSLKKLVEYGEGFIVSDTPEYMEGRGYNVSREVTRRLHRGDFSIQGYIDLHGLNVYEAWEVFNRFLKESVMTGKRAVLIVHGRGLSSPKMPVLKTKVCQWLTTGAWRKWVMAFSSARACDGGAGATYVLLRNQPVTRRYRKKGFDRY